jgi:hypothetical protein
MAGTVVVDAVKSSTTGAPTFQNTNGTQIGTLCRAWVNFNGVSGASIRASFNVSSVTRNATGDYTLNFTNAMPDANYAATGMSREADNSSFSWVGIFSSVSTYYATGSFRFQTATHSGLAADSGCTNVAIFR